MTPVLIRQARSRRTDARRGARAGFTLVEVLAAVLLISIVLPIVMQGVTIATGIANTAKRRTEATGLAQSKLAELVATATALDGAQSGDFAPDWPDYRWESSIVQWTGDTTVTMDQLDVRVVWIARGREESVTVSTLLRSSETGITQ